MFWTKIDYLIVFSKEREGQITDLIVSFNFICTSESYERWLNDRYIPSSPSYTWSFLDWERERQSIVQFEQSISNLHVDNRFDEKRGIPKFHAFLLSSGPVIVKFNINERKAKGQGCRSISPLFSWTVSIEKEMTLSFHSFDKSSVAEWLEALPRNCVVWVQILRNTQSFCFFSGDFLF